MSKDNQKEGKSVIFTFVNKHKVASLITSAALVVGLGFAASNVKACSDADINTKPNNSIERIIDDNPTDIVEEIQNLDNEPVGPVLVKTQNNKNEDNENKEEPNIYYSRTAQNYIQNNGLNENKNNNSNNNGNNSNSNGNNSNNNGNGDNNKPNTKPHKHQYGPWKALDDTYEIRTCYTDGTTQKRKHHGYGPYIYNPKTGLEESICSDCGHVKTRTHVHSFGPWYSLNDELEERECSVSGTKETRSHTYGDYVYNSETGLEEATCETCGHIISKEHVHSFGPWYSLNDELEERECSVSGTKETRSHTYGDYVYNSETGLEEATCETCGHIISKEHIHTWSEYKNNGENEISECEVCGETRTRNHNFGEWTALNDEQEIRYCSNDDATETRSHTYGAYTYNSRTGREEATCKTCGHTKSRAHTHSWSSYTNNGSNEISHCYECGQTRTRSHSFGPWLSLNDELEVRYCSRDNESQTRSHTYGAYIYNSATGKEEATCETCGHTISREHTHTWSTYRDNGENEISECEVCDETRTREHSFTEWTIDPNDSTKETRTCNTCGRTETRAHVHTHTLVNDYEAHNESGQCVVTTWQVCTDPNCPDGVGTHLNETTVTQAHQYTPISEYEVVEGRWIITDKCTVCNHTRNRNSRQSELGTQSTPLSTMSISNDNSNTNAIIPENETKNNKGKQKKLTK